MLSRLYSWAFSARSEAASGVKAPLFADLVRTVDAKSNDHVDLNAVTVKKLQLQHFYDNTIKFNPETMPAIKRARFYETVETLSKNNRSQKYVNMQNMDAPEASRARANSKYAAHLEETRLFSSSELLRKKVIFEAAKLAVDEDIQLPSLSPISTRFGNRYIDEYLSCDRGFLDSQGKIDKLPDKFKGIWSDDWYFTKLKGAFANVNLSMVPSEFTVHDCSFFTLIYLPDFHPFAATLTKSNPSIVIAKARNANMSTYALRESTKVYKRLFWDTYVRLRFDKGNVTNEYNYLDTVFGKVELPKEGIAKKGFYFFKIKHKIELKKENEALFGELSSEIRKSVEAAANTPWDSLIGKCRIGLKRNTHYTVRSYNDMFAEKQVPVKMVAVEKRLGR